MQLLRDFGNGFAKSVGGFFFMWFFMLALCGGLSLLFALMDNFPLLTILLLVLITAIGLFIGYLKGEEDPQSNDIRGRFQMKVEVHEQLVQIRTRSQTRSHHSSSPSQNELNLPHDAQTRIESSSFDPCDRSWE